MPTEIGEEPVVVARVHVALADGCAEIWLVPMDLTDDALSYRARLYPPDGAVIVGVDSLLRPRQSEMEIILPRTELIRR